MTRSSEIAISVSDFRAGLSTPTCCQCGANPATVNVAITARTMPWLAFLPKLDSLFASAKAVRTETGSVRLCASCARTAERISALRAGSVFLVAGWFALLALLDSFSIVRIPPNVMLALAAGLGIGVVVAANSAFVGKTIDCVSLKPDHVVLRGSPEFRGHLTKQLPAASHFADG